MHITILGTGYVGFTTAAALAYLGEVPLIQIIFASAESGRGRSTRSPSLTLGAEGSRC